MIEDLADVEVSNFWAEESTIISGVTINSAYAEFVLESDAGFRCMTWTGHPQAYLSLSRYKQPCGKISFVH
jgi:hypothetical protein